MVETTYIAAEPAQMTAEMMIMEIYVALHQVIKGTILELEFVEFIMLD